MSSSTWEAFTLEWAHTLKGDYARVESLGGSGDEGRDVVAYVTEELDSECDYFQCKHLAEPLQPNAVWIELGKLVYFTFIRRYPVPRRYFFVAPLGVGTSLAKLLKSPDALRAGLLEHWDAKCRDALTAASAILCEGGLRAWIDGFDFSTITYLHPGDMVEQHRRSAYHVLRFGGGLPLRTSPAPPPPSIQADEAVYVEALLEAYSDREPAPFASPDQLAGRAPYFDHFSRSRFEFYSAEALRAFSRDNLPIGSFEGLKDEVLNGVADVVEMHHPNGFERVLRTVAQAKVVPLDSHPLNPRTSLGDRGGICHQLVNDRRICWVRR